jgi:hypothetical protein
MELGAHSAERRRALHLRTTWSKWRLLILRQTTQHIGHAAMMRVTVCRLSLQNESNEVPQSFGLTLRPQAYDVAGLPRRWFRMRPLPHSPTGRPVLQARPASRGLYQYVLLFVSPERTDKNVRTQKSPAEAELFDYSINDSAHCSGRGSENLTTSEATCSDSRWAHWPSTSFRSAKAG